MFFLFVAILNSMLEEEGHPNLQCLRFCSDWATGAPAEGGWGVWGAGAALPLIGAPCPPHVLRVLSPFPFFHVKVSLTAAQGVAWYGVVCFSY